MRRFRSRITSSRGARNQHSVSLTRPRGRGRSRNAETRQTSSAIANVAGHPSPGSSVNEELPTPVHSTQNEATASSGEFNIVPPALLTLTNNPIDSQDLFNVFDYQPHTSQSSFDPISVHISLKIKQKTWESRFFKLSILPKSARDLAKDKSHG